MENIAAYPGLNQLYGPLKKDPEMLQEMLQAQCRDTIRTRSVRCCPLNSTTFRPAVATAFNTRSNALISPPVILARNVIITTFPLVFTRFPTYEHMHVSRGNPCRSRSFGPCDLNSPFPSHYVRCDVRWIRRCRRSRTRRRWCAL